MSQFYAIVAFLLIANFSSAQESTPAEAAPQAHKGMHSMHVQKHNALVESLELNSEQQEQFSAAMKEHHAKMKTNHNNKEQAKKDRKAAFKAEHKRFNKQLATFLSQEQLEKVRAHQKEMRKKHHKKKAD